MAPEHRLHLNPSATHVTPPPVHSNTVESQSAFDQVLSALNDTSTFGKLRMFAQLCLSTSVNTSVRFDDDFLLEETATNNFDDVSRE